MLKKYFDLFFGYFQENGSMTASDTPGKFVLGLLPLLQQAENAFMPYNVYKELYDAFKSQSCEIKYGLGRHTVRLGVLNPSQFVKYMVSNVKSGRLVKKYPTGKYPAFQYWLKDGNLVRCVSFGDPSGEYAEKFYEDAYVYNESGSTFCVIYDGADCGGGLFEDHKDRDAVEDYEGYDALQFLFWINDELGNTVCMFHAFSYYPGKWEITYEETIFDGTEAIRLLNATAWPYHEEIELAIEDIARKCGLECKKVPVIDGYSFALDEYDQNDLK